MEKKFRPGQSGNPAGRPKGARTRYELTKRFFQDLLTVWQENSQPTAKATSETRGIAALRVMAFEHPEQFAKLFASVMPKSVELNIDEELGRCTDEELAEIIRNAREKLRQAEALN
jgi:hypothetical protein